MDAPAAVVATTLPPSIRILPNRVRLRVGLAAGLGLAVALGSFPTWVPGAAWKHWAAASVCLAIAVWCAVEMFVQLPIIEASELGVAIWFHGPYKRPFFVPWSRVSQVGLTQVTRSRGPLRRQVDALAIVIIEDGEFRIPAIPRMANAPVRGSRPAELAWSARELDGSPRRWAALMQAMKSQGSAAR